MKYKKWIYISSAVIVVVLILIIWSVNSNKNSSFSTEVGGNIYSEEYEEKFKVIENKVEVAPKHITELNIKSYVDLDKGSLKYELFDPQGHLVQGEEISQDKTYLKEEKMKYIPGTWVVKYYINSQTNGSYRLTLHGDK